jgi:hypothetical protein
MDNRYEPAGPVHRARLTDEQAVLILACAVADILASERAAGLPPASHAPARRAPSRASWRLSGRHWVRPVGRSAAGRAG